MNTFKGLMLKLKGREGALKVLRKQIETEEARGELSEEEFDKLYATLDSELDSIATLSYPLREAMVALGNDLKNLGENLAQGASLLEAGEAYECDRILKETGPKLLALAKESEKLLEL